jgi:hypothetical protein
VPRRVGPQGSSPARVRRAAAARGAVALILGRLDSATERARSSALAHLAARHMYLQVVSSSRSQVIVRPASTAARLSWLGPSVSVHWCLLLAVAIVTHLVTRLPAGPVTSDCCPYILPSLRGWVRRRSRGP